MSGKTSPAGAVNRLISADSSTLLDRVGDKPQNLRPLSETQAKVDAMVSHSIMEATNLKTLTAMVAGGFAFRFTRIGTLATASPILAKGPTILPMIARGGSYAAALGAESFVFAGVGRELNRVEGHAPTQPFVKEWAQAAVTLGALKSVSSLARGENIVLQHLLADLGMVGGHYAGHALGVIDKPPGTFADQMLEAEALNWSMKGGMSLVNGLLPRLHATEKSLDFYLQSNAADLLSRNQPSFPIFSEAALAAEGGPGMISSESSRTEPLEGLSLSLPSGKGGKPVRSKRGSAGSPLDARSQLQQALIRAGWDSDHADSFLQTLQRPGIVHLETAMQEMIPLVEKMGELDLDPVKQSETLLRMRFQSARSLQATLKGFSHLITDLQDSTLNKETQTALIDHLPRHGGKTLSITFQNFRSFLEVMESQAWPAEAREEMAALVLRESVDLTPLLKNLPLVKKAMGEAGWSFNESIDYLKQVQSLRTGLYRAPMSLNSAIQPQVGVLGKMQANGWPATQQREFLTTLVERENNHYLGSTLRNLGRILELGRKAGWTTVQQSEILGHAFEEKRPFTGESRIGTTLKNLPLLFDKLVQEGFDGDLPYQFLNLHFQSRARLNVLLHEPKESPLNDLSYPLETILNEYRTLLVLGVEPHRAVEELNSLYPLAGETFIESLSIYRSLVSGADPITVLKENYEKTPQTREAVAVATMFYLSKQSAESRLRVLNELKLQVSKAEGRISMGAAEVLGYFAREGWIHPAQENIWKELGLKTIEFRDRGNGFSALASFMAGFVPEKQGTKSAAVQKYEAKSEGSLSLRRIQSEADLVAFLKTQGGDETVPRVLGRSHLYALPAKNRLIVLKYGEPTAYIKRLLELDVPDPILLSRLSAHSPLAKEARWLVNISKAGLKLKSQLPDPVLDGQGDPLIFQFEDGRHAIAFKVGEEYYHYLDDPQLSDRQFFDGLEKSVHDVFFLARHQVLHTAPIRLFHNAEPGAAQRSTGDRGRYVVAPDIVFDFDTRYGMGRLNDWPGALKYGNFGVSGLRDFEELSYPSYEDPRRVYRLTHHKLLPELRGLGRRSNRRALTEALILGNSLMAATLYIGNRLVQEAKGPWQGDAFWEKYARPWQSEAFLEKYAGWLQSIFTTAYSAYHQVPYESAKETISPRADWRRFARQLAFFMTPDYVTYLEEGALVSDFPTAEIYGPDVSLPQKDFGPYRGSPIPPRAANLLLWNILQDVDSIASTFHPERGFVGPDGNPEALSLGPVNGQFPIREFEPAFWGIFW